jgi:hypothetical protein
MKKLFVLLSIVAFTSGNLLSQDIIIKNDKTEIKSKIIEIQEEVIKYKSFDYLDGPIRNILVSDVFMILYENGTRETFTVKSDEKKVEEQTPVVTKPPAQQKTPIYEVPKEVPQNIELKKKLGFIFGIDGGIYFPFNSDFSEIYGVMFRGGLVWGYWGKGFGIENRLNYGSVKGEPYVYGYVENASCKLSITDFDLSAYWKTGGHKVFFYIGGGIGVCSIAESITGTLYGNQESNSVSLVGFDVHASLGMKLGAFCWQLSPASITVSENDKNFGGVLFSIGLFF